MADASARTTEGESAILRPIEYGRYKCMCCNTRYWKRNKLIRRAAQCKGVRFVPGGSRQRCKGWRCRFNDQCPLANAACPLCGAFKPLEFQSDLPSSPSSQAYYPVPAVPAVSSHLPANASSEVIPAPLAMEHLQGRDSSSVPAQKPCSISGEDIPIGTVTHLPLLEGMTERFLTEV